LRERLMRRDAKTAKAKIEAKPMEVMVVWREWVSDGLPKRRAFIRQLNPTFSTRMVAGRA
jgi:hypothetical protein